MGALLSPFSTGTELAQLIPPYVPQASPWIAVRQRFAQLNQNTSLTLLQKVDGRTKLSGVLNCLNQGYYDLPSGEANSLLIGSWGKDLATRPPRDVDVYFVLPPDVYYRFQNRLGNVQSALLQEVRGVLAPTYPNTTIQADRHVVLISFGSYAVEVAPVFLLTDGSYWICDTTGTGRYKVANPIAEAEYIHQVDLACNGNLRPLIRMLKAWQEYCSVPVKSFHLELVAAEFLAQSPWRHYNYFWFDWITRDFFAYLYSKASTSIAVPGLAEWINLGAEWQSRALTAWSRAAKACDLDQQNFVDAADEEWQQIFGDDIPRRPRWS
jgi:hypothetical protein